LVTKSQDDAVRTYLLSLQNPDVLVDDNKVKELEKRIEKESDPAKRLELREQRRKLGDPAEAKNQAQEAFVKHAKSWADDKGISPDSFREEGVPPAVLREAGLMPKRGRGSRRSGSATRSRVSSETVRDALKKKRGAFTINQVQEETGASVGMVRNVINEAEKAGEVTKDGTDPNHQGPGRAPIVYKKA
jgi:hypothetical protein